MVMSVRIPSSCWRTVCGWEFGSSACKPSEDLPSVSKQVCQKCLPEEFRAAVARELADDEETEDKESSEGEAEENDLDS